MSTSTLTSQPAATSQPATGRIVSAWARGRSHYTPWICPRLRALGLTRIAVATLLIPFGGVLMAVGHPALAAIPYAGAVLLLAIGLLDTLASDAVRRH